MVNEQVDKKEATRILKEGVFFLTNKYIGGFILGDPKDSTAMYQTSMFGPLPIALIRLPMVDLDSLPDYVKWDVLSLKDVIKSIGFDVEGGDNKTLRECYVTQMELIKHGVISEEHKFDLDAMTEYQYSTYKSIDKSNYRITKTSSHLWQKYFEAIEKA